MENHAPHLPSQDTFSIRYAEGAAIFSARDSAQIN